MATAVQAVTIPPRSAPSFLTRLLGYWSGWSAFPAVEKPPLVMTTRITGKEDAPPIDGITVAQWLWGPGFHVPGDEAHVLEMVKPFALNPAMSMLDVAAGLGGCARAIAAGFGIYVTGFERDPELARRGMEMSLLQGMQKRAPVTPYDPANIELRSRAFDCILGRQATSVTSDRERFLRALIRSLKARGQLLLTDFVVDPKAGARSELALWERHQANPPQLWTLAQYTDCLTSLGFDIRITEDTTQRYRSLILTGWKRLLQTVDLRGLPRKHVLVILDEAETWVRTIVAIDSGALKMVRFYALAAKRSTRR